MALTEYSSRRTSVANLVWLHNVAFICLISLPLPQRSVPESVSDLPVLTVMNHWQLGWSLANAVVPMPGLKLGIACPIFERKLKTFFCLNTHSLHCDSFFPLAILGVIDGQLELNWTELNVVYCLWSQHENMHCSEGVQLVPRPHIERLS